MRNSDTSLITQEWYKNLIDECKAIITEAVFTSRWALVEGYWQLGKRIREEEEPQKNKFTTHLLQDLAVKIGIGERTLWYALQTYDKYPDIGAIPEGKNISWNKLITKYLPQPANKEEKLTEEQKSKFINKVIPGDCIVELGKLPDKSIDLIYVDPPYNVGADDWDKYEVEEFNTFTENWILECLRLLKNESNLYIQFPADKIYWLQDFILSTYSLIPTTTIIWSYRNLVQGRDSKNKYLSTYQPILHYNFGSKPLNFDTEWNDERFDVWDIATPQTNFKEGKYHKTQKPLELMERIIRTGSKIGDIVLDPMAGSGTTGVAALKNNRDFILIEKEDEYIDIIHRRLNDIR